MTDTTLLAILASLPPIITALGFATAKIIQAMKAGDRRARR